MKRLFNKKRSTSPAQPVPNDAATSSPAPPGPPGATSAALAPPVSQTQQQPGQYFQPASSISPPFAPNPYVQAPMQTYAVQFVPQLVPVQFQPPRVTDVPNAIGWSCAAPQFDYTYVLALADHISLSSVAAKSAATALRKEFKHAVPIAQERAVRLMGILARNSDHRFKKEIASKKFTNELEHLYTNKKTEAPVKTMVLRVLSPLAYEFSRDADLNSITALYNKIKSPSMQVNGEPLDPSDDLFTPTSDPRGPARSSRPRGPHRIPTMKTQMLDLRKEAEQIRGYSRLLNEAIAFAPIDEDLKRNEIVEEFWSKCFSGKEWIEENLDWASSVAEKSRREIETSAVENNGHRVADDEEQTTMNEGNDHHFASNNPFAPIVAPNSAIPAAASAETEEEKSLSILLAAHSEVLEALSLYDDRQSHNSELRNLQQVEDRSRKETKFDRANAGLPDQDGNYLGVIEDRGDGGSSSSDHSHGGLIPEYYGRNGNEKENYGYPVDKKKDPFEDPKRTIAEEEKNDRRQSRNPYAAFLETSPGQGGYSIPNTVPEHGTLSASPTTSADLHHDETHYGQFNQSGLDSTRSGQPSSSSYDEFAEHRRPRATTQSSESSIAIPSAPSAKALGKLRRVSAREDSEADEVEQQRRLEEQLRNRYQVQYQEEQTLRQQTKDI